MRDASEKARSWIETMWPVMATLFGMTLFINTTLTQLESNQKHILEQLNDQNVTLQVERLTIRVQHLEKEHAKTRIVQYKEEREIGGKDDY